MKKTNKKSGTKKAKKGTMTIHEFCWYTPTYYRFYYDDVWCR